MSNTLRRDKRIRLFDIGNYSFEVRNDNDDVLLDSNDNYFIYLTNVNFIGGNIIEGRYKGVLSDNSPILDSHCKNIVTDGQKYLVDNQQIKTARMVAVNNKEKVILIINNSR